MGDRVSARIAISGVLKGDEEIKALAKAIEDDGAGENYQPMSSDDAEALIRTVSAAGQPLYVGATNVNGGEFDVIQDACCELGLAYIQFFEGYPGGWSAGAHYCKGHVYEEVLVDDNERPLATLSEIERAVSEGAVDSLLARLRIFMNPLPLTIEPQTPGLAAENQVTLPDGTVVEWDERLRTVL